MSQNSIRSSSAPKSRRWWLVTYNNPPENYIEAIANLKPDYAEGQLEKGENGTFHVQCVLWFKDRVPTNFWRGKPCWAKPIPTSHAERSIRYCTKEETRQEDPFTIGKCPRIPKQPSRARKSGKDWDAALALAKERRVLDIKPDILIPHLTNLQKLSHLFGKPTGTPGRPRGLYLVGPPGTGKSYFARQQFQESLFIKSQNKWWDGYHGERTILLDDLDRLGVCLGHYLKIWLDEYPCSGEIKGGNTNLCHETFVITSNYWPHELWEDLVMAEAISRRCVFYAFPRLGEHAMVSYDPRVSHIDAQLGTKDLNSDFVWHE